MKKFLVTVILLFVVGSALAFFGVRFALQAGTDKAVPLVSKALGKFGMDLENAIVGAVDLDFPLTASWEALEGRVVTNERSPLARRLGFDVHIDRVRLEPLSFSMNRFKVSMEGIFAKSIHSLQSDSGPEIKELWVRIDSIEKNLDIKLQDPLPGLRSEIAALQSLLAEGKVYTPISIAGTLGLTINDTPIELECYTVRRDGAYTLEAEREGVKALVEIFDGSLTPAEIDVVSKYPLQAPQMLFIRNYAQEVSSAAAKSSRSVPQDAYRHLLWSYLLTKRFGTVMAEEITDAHEVGSLTNTAADHRMDYNNNEIGRGYAMEGRLEKEIRTLVMTDPDVIRVAR